MEKKVWIYVVTVGILVSLMTITLVSATIGNNGHPVMQFLDKILTGRIWITRSYADIRYWGLFKANMVNGVVDNGFAYLFFAYGIVIGVLYIISNIYLIARLYKENNGMGIILLITCLLYTFMETTYTINFYMVCNFVYKIGRANV